MGDFHKTLSKLQAQYYELIKTFFSDDVIPYEIARFMGILPRVGILYGHKSRVRSVELSSDNTFLVTVSDDKTLKIWNTTTGEIVRSFPHFVYCCDMSLDNTLICSGMVDNTFKLIQIQNGRKIKNFVGHRSCIYSLKISKDNSFIVSASHDKTCRIWNTNTGSSRSILRHGGYVYSCAVSNDSSFIVSASQDKTLKLWNSELGTEIMTLMGHTDRVYCCVISSNDKYIASASGDKNCILWNVKTGKKIRTFKGHEDRVYCCVISQDDSLLISGSRDNTIKSWAIDSGLQLRSFSGHVGSVYCVGIAADKTFIISGSGDNTLKIWDTETGQEMGKHHSRGMSCVQFHNSDVLNFDGDATLGSYFGENKIDAAASILDLTSKENINKYVYNSTTMTMELSSIFATTSSYATDDSFVLGRY